MGNSALVWWLLGAPVVLAIVDAMRTRGGSTSLGSARART